MDPRALSAVLVTAVVRSRVSRRHPAPRWHLRAAWVSRGRACRKRPSRDERIVPMGGRLPRDRAADDSRVAREVVLHVNECGSMSANDVCMRARISRFGDRTLPSARRDTRRGGMCAAISSTTKCASSFTSSRRARRGAMTEPHVEGRNPRVTCSTCSGSARNACSTACGRRPRAARRRGARVRSEPDPGLEPRERDRAGADARLDVANTSSSIGVSDARVALDRQPARRHHGGEWRSSWGMRSRNRGRSPQDTDLPVVLRHSRCAAIASSTSRAALAAAPRRGAVRASGAVPRDVGADRDDVAARGAPSVSGVSLLDESGGRVLLALPEPWRPTRPRGTSARDQLFPPGARPRAARGTARARTAPDAKLQLQPHFLFNTLNTITRVDRRRSTGGRAHGVRLSELYGCRCAMPPSRKCHSRVSSSSSSTTSRFSRSVP